MDNYKNAILKMVDEIEDAKILKRIYTFIKYLR